MVTFFYNLLTTDFKNLPIAHVIRLFYELIDGRDGLNCNG